MPFSLPPVQTNHAGRPRRVGFELEYAGLDLDESARIVAGALGGTHREAHGFRRQVVDTPYGDFDVQLDMVLFNERGYAQFLAKFGIDVPDDWPPASLERLLTRITSKLIPLEVVTPPLPLDKLHVIEQVRDALFRGQATGTGGAMLHAFGLHINPEVISTDPDSLLAHLRAFLLLHGWLIEQGQIDLTRRILPWIYPFPPGYVRLVLDVDYRPNLEQLAVDYLAYNSTRNRPLDLLPLLTWLGAIEPQSDALPKGVSPRPTWHFRMPNSSVDESDWRVSASWNRWVTVERLAHDRERLADMCRRCLDLTDGRADAGDTRWLACIDKWLG